MFAVPSDFTTVTPTQTIPDSSTGDYVFILVSHDPSTAVEVLFDMSSSPPAQDLYPTGVMLSGGTVKPVIASLGLPVVAVRRVRGTGAAMVIALPKDPVGP
jgi:hypothetical protein